MRQKFYSGVGEIGLILNEVYRLYKDENAKSGAMEILDHYLDTSTEDNEKFTGVTTVLSFLMAEISYICWIVAIPIKNYPPN